MPAADRRRDRIALAEARSSSARLAQQRLCPRLQTQFEVASHSAGRRMAIDGSAARHFCSTSTTPAGQSPGTSAGPAPAGPRRRHGGHREPGLRPVSASDVVGKRPLAGQQLPEHDAQRVNVATAVEIVGLPSVRRDRRLRAARATCRPGCRRNRPPAWRRRPSSKADVEVGQLGAGHRPPAARWPA